MNALATRRGAAPDALEVGTLARELAAAYRDRVYRHKHELGLSTPEAAARAEEPCSLSRMWAIQDCPPEQVTWGDLEELGRTSPERALRRWEEIKQAAREDLRSGDRAARAVEGRPDLWKRAQFLALREELSREWGPRNGIERQLIDQMAQAQTAVFCWMEQLSEAGCPDDRAAAMADRFNRMFARTLRALCNLRKVPLAVVVQNAGQVNVGGQQVNVAGREG